MNERTPVFRDPEKPIEERVTDLLSGLSLEEKISQMVYVDGELFWDPFTVRDAADRYQGGGK